MRSAKAPSISAGVMIANMPWNMTKTYSGIVPESVSGVMPLSITLPRVADEGVALAEGQAVARTDPEHAHQAGGDQALHQDLGGRRPGDEERGGGHHEPAGAGERDPVEHECPFSPRVRRA